jgi:hypothetical protein
MGVRRGEVTSQGKQENSGAGNRGALPSNAAPFVFPPPECRGRRRVRAFPTAVTASCRQRAGGAAAAGTQA